MDATLIVTCARCSNSLVAGDKEYCSKCKRRLERELQNTEKKFKGLATVEKGVKLILDGLHEGFGLDLTDGNFTDTPKRVARAYSEIFEGLANTDEEVEKILESTFEEKHSQMIMVSGIHTYSMCPHHLLPVELRASVAYLPNGRVLGISKLSRLTTLLSARPVLQEALTDDIANKLMKCLKPKGAAVVIQARHFCMIMRGAKQIKSCTSTSAMLGAFQDDQSLKGEFFKMIGLALEDVAV